MKIKTIIGMLGLLLAIFSILLKEEIQSLWDLFLWLPITIGYAIWFHTDGFISIFKKHKEELCKK